MTASGSVELILDFVTENPSINHALFNFENKVTAMEGNVYFDVFC